MINPKKGNNGENKKRKHKKYNRQSPIMSARIEFRQTAAQALN